MVHIEIKPETKQALTRYTGELITKHSHFISADTAIQELLSEHTKHKLKGILAENP